MGSEQDGQIQFVLLKGEPGHPDAEARTTYVIKELNDKGIKTEQLQLDTAMWDTAQAKDKMDAWLSGPNANKIEVVIANNDAMAMGAVEALKAQQVQHSGVWRRCAARSAGAGEIRCTGGHSTERC